jgi:hypothetical protein
MGSVRYGILNPICEIRSGQNHQRSSLHNHKEIQ